MVTSARHQSIVEQLLLRIEELEEQNAELLREKIVIDPACQKAVETFGKVYEMTVAIEEMAELTQAVTKVIRDKPNFDNVAEEIADVEISMGLLKAAFNNADKVKEWKNKKILRLTERIMRGYD